MGETLSTPIPPFPTSLATILKEGSWLILSIYAINATCRFRPTLPRLFLRSHYCGISHVWILVKTLSLSLLFKLNSLKVHTSSSYYNSARFSIYEISGSYNGLSQGSLYFLFNFFHVISRKRNHAGQDNVSHLLGNL